MQYTCSFLGGVSARKWLLKNVLSVHWLDLHHSNKEEKNRHRTLISLY